jgi:ABC-2 type transport system permease protein
MFPGWLISIAQYLPFKYLAYFPATAMLGRYTHQQLLTEMAIQTAWVLGLLVLNRLAYNRGVRRYAAHGG